MNLELQNASGLTIQVTFATVKNNIVTVAWKSEHGVGEQYDCRIRDGRVIGNTRMRFWRLTNESLRKVHAFVGKQTASRG